MATLRETHDETFGRGFVDDTVLPSSPGVARMRVMVLGLRGLSKVQGGVETHAAQLYRRLAALGCDVEVLGRTPFVPAGETNVGGVRVRRLWSPQRSGLA